MASRNAKVAVVGSGYWGKNLVRNFHALGALELVCDLDEDRLREAEEVCGAKTTPRFEDVLDDPQIQAVVLAVPAALHYNSSSKLCLAGKMSLWKSLCPCNPARAASSSNSQTRIIAF